MYEKGVPVTIDGAQYEMVFTTAALLQITEKYGGIEEMAERLNGPENVDWDNADVRAEKAKKQKAARSRAVLEIPWLIATMVNQGLLLADPKAELLLPDFVALHTAPSELSALSSAAMKAIAIGMGTYREDEGGEHDLVLEEIEKNAQGAGA